MKKTLLSRTSESWMRSCYNTQILVRSFFSCCCWILPLISVYCARTYHLNIRFFKVLDFIHPPEFVFTQVTPKRSFLLSPRVPLSPPPARVRLRTREAGNILIARGVLSGALWRRGGKMKESLQLRLWNLNNCIEKVDANADAEMTLLMTSLTLASVFQCLFTFALVLASCWFPEIWQLSQRGATEELEV